MKRCVGRSAHPKDNEKQPNNRSSTFKTERKTISGLALEGKQDRYGEC
ncbi:hypothetical protein LMJF_33_2725 [Leishmania major strain Friedlin]|uniref:Uncharacterized protein n=1 Tax=Leishmania major TaxID=5664 RepID=Q4Q3R3_LEIMA|nr:hypothetical protein LMJF_33_2725 [Leishmania major strain Friedlin]CAJ06759.1 hypothetical protein LMJF_33_2725 [Leishmania major strain Friedlin]|eukprot:XP_001686035.1 hypothetical protein LMJF_33_2725 [Leishmania major strain Friedlin]